MVNHYWIMTDNGLECVDCEEETDSINEWDSDDNATESKSSERMIPQEL
jgi:hypothetical protein